jgi:hypothetical protein
VAAEEQEEIAMAVQMTAVHPVPVGFDDAVNDRLHRRTLTLSFAPARSNLLIFLSSKLPARPAPNKTRR